MNQVTNPGVPALPVLSATTAIHGPLVKFLDPDWWLDNVKVPPAEQFYGLGIRFVIQHFKDGRFIRDKEHVEPPDGRDAPELEDYVATLNAEVPTTEWELGLDGNKRPPWSLGYAVYLLRIRDALICTAVNATGGHRAGVLRLRSQIQWKCFMEGQNHRARPNTRQRAVQ
jgi:hypothetical protein